MTTVALEGTGTTIAFTGSGFVADLISLTLSERAREVLETTHLKTSKAKTYKPGERVDLGTMEAVFDHNPAEVMLVGLQPGPIVIGLPDGAGSITLSGFVSQQGSQEMKMDQRLVTKVLIVLTGTQSDKTATPIFSPSGGVITTADLITLTCATPGAAIWYTIDGSTPTTSSTLYTAPFTLPIGTATAKAIGTKAGMTDSDIATAVFTVSAALTYSVVWEDSNATTSNQSVYTLNSIRSTIALPAGRKIYFEVAAIYAPDTQNRVQIGLVPSTLGHGGANIGHPLGVGTGEYVAQIPDADDGGMYFYNRSPNVLPGTKLPAISDRLGILWDGVTGAFDAKVLLTGGASQSVFSIKTGMTGTWYLAFGGSTGGSGGNVQAQMFVTPASLTYAAPSGYEAGWSD